MAEEQRKTAEQQQALQKQMQQCITKPVPAPQPVPAPAPAKEPTPMPQPVVVQMAPPAPVV